jgi:hypothetical protein
MALHENSNGKCDLNFKVGIYIFCILWISTRHLKKMPLNQIPNQFDEIL